MAEGHPRYSKLLTIVVVSDSAHTLHSPGLRSAGKRLRDPKHWGSSTAFDFKELKVAQPFWGLSTGRSRADSKASLRRAEERQRPARGQSGPFAHLLYQSSLWVFFLFMLHVVPGSRLNVLYLIVTCIIALNVTTTFIFFPPSLMFTSREGVSIALGAQGIDMVRFRQRLKMEDWFNT